MDIQAPFYAKKNKAEKNYPIGNILKRSPKRGEVGLEIECEGNKFKQSGLPSNWTYHKDGSLRGEDNAEYVLGAPIMFDEVKSHIDALWDMFKGYGTVLDDSNRTSVHVHLNAQSWHLNRLTSFLGLYFTVEEILTEWCGEHRVGNLFCLRGKDAEGIITQIKKFIQNNGRYDLRDGLHYSGLNVQALVKFGSLEIRTMRGVSDPETILTWVRILEHMYKLSAEYPDPRSIPGLMSSEGPLNFLDHILGPDSSTVRREVDMTVDQMRESMYEGVRIAQEICYCRDWTDFKADELRTDPFGREKKSPQSEMDQFIAMYGANAPQPASLNLMNNINWATTEAAVMASPGLTLPVGWGAPSAPEEYQPDAEPNDDWTVQFDTDEDDF